MSRTAQRGFSLVEILIVVVILGILAAVAIPRFAGATAIARENSLKDDLRLLRSQISVYKSQHQLNPGYPGGDPAQAPTETVSHNQLLQFSDNRGNIAATLSDIYKWGPYLSELPPNPINGSRAWKILADTDPFTPDNTTGWLYQPSTGAIRANNPGADSVGKAFIEY